MVITVTVAVASAAGTAAAAPNFPRPTGWVSDGPDVIPAAEQGGVESSLDEYNRRTQGEVVVAYVANLGGESVEDYATDLFGKWGIGDKAKDSGVLLLVALDERKMRIETGYGAEAELTDIESNDILETQVKPRLQAGDYAGAADAGQRAIRAALGDDQAAAPAPAGRSGGQPAGTSSGGGIGLLFFLLPVIFLMLSAGGAGRRRRRRGNGGGFGFPIFIGGGGWGGGGYGGGGGFGGAGGSGGGGGGGGGGFGGFGGGDSGGGGASGDW